MNTKVQEQLKVLEGIIRATVPVERIFLFGSYTEGVPNKDSDLDIFVVMADSSTLSNIAAMQKISLAIIDKITMPVDLIITKQNQFDERKMAPTLERYIVEKGIEL